jgi:hypothetical protein
MSNQNHYFYLPIPKYSGQVLKCAGMVSDENLKWFVKENPDAWIVIGYRGDRVRAGDFSIFNG